MHTYNSERWQIVTVEHAVNKTVASQGEKITLEVNKDKIVTQETFAEMPLLKTVILPNGKRISLKKNNIYCGYCKRGKTS